MAAAVAKCNGRGKPYAERRTEANPVGTKYAACRIQRLVGDGMPASACTNMEHHAGNPYTFACNHCGGGPRQMPLVVLAGF